MYRHILTTVLQLYHIGPEYDYIQLRSIYADRAFFESVVVPGQPDQGLQRDACLQGVAPLNAHSFNIKVEPFRDLNIALNMLGLMRIKTGNPEWAPTPVTAPDVAASPLLVARRGIGGRGGRSGGGHATGATKIQAPPRSKTASAPPAKRQKRN
jgi:hypothetical protein